MAERPNEQGNSTTEAKYCNFGQCKLIGCISPSTRGGGHWYCSWHWILLGSDISLNRIEVFREFIRDEKDSYCSLWSHQSVEYLWSQVQGGDTIPFEKAMPCKQRFGCPVQNLRDMEAIEADKVFNSQ